MAQNPRKKAVSMLMEIDKNSAYTNIEMNKLRNLNTFSETDIRFIGELVNGVQKRKLTLDFIIASRSSVKLNKISPFVLNVLRIAIYQMLYMDRVPVSAAVNESVKLIKNSSVSRLSGYVNAVLRSVEGNELSSLDRKNQKDLSIIYSIPEWLISRWINIFGVEFTIQLSESLNVNLPLCIRRNPNVKSCEFSSCLYEEGVQLECVKLDRFESFDFCYKVTSSKLPITKTKSFLNGDFYIQDPAASLAAYLLEPKAGETVIDMCAAPGGKSVFIAQLMNNSGTVHAFDIYDHKIDLISENCIRHNLSIVKPYIQDATIYNSKYENVADRIICDVPCSGFGLMGKKPDIRYSRKESDIAELASISAKILDNAAKYLKSNGVLVFSTCTIDPEENEKTVETFLNNHKDFSPFPFDNDVYFRTFYPHTDGTDGFFVSRFKKNGVS